MRPVPQEKDIHVAYCNDKKLRSPSHCPTSQSYALKRCLLQFSAVCCQGSQPRGTGGAVPLPLPVPAPHHPHSYGPSASQGTANSRLRDKGQQGGCRLQGNPLCEQTTLQDRPAPKPLTAFKDRPQVNTVRKSEEYSFLSSEIVTHFSPRAYKAI